jgi:hypothetical protein
LKKVNMFNLAYNAQNVSLGDICGRQINIVESLSE